ncbi:hypothetical protein EA772_14280 [Pedobacter sp. G11]|uniref:hypothetical protein n=1 Tax=Pedobacter sp. G11 TaxID=2482728 RepID=UPI000F5E85A7|nr:hypothetical protein [Pedobacter sp. G11]AZI26446.1 hypothetical protein EA772_14280 [Pedobacter sp. G11]
MPKRKNLKGIPHNITKSFFGTERYYKGGYMGDWLLNAAKHLHLAEVSLDVMKAIFSPEKLNIRPLILNAVELKEIIYKELTANGFHKDFIKEAVIDFQFPDPKINNTRFYCFPYLIDTDGNRYESGRIMEEGLEAEFDPFEESNIN